VILTFVYIHKLDPSPSILIEESSAINLVGKQLFAGGIISQDFVSYYDNLGIIAVRFKTFSRINDDTLIFRLKEEGNSSWYYVANYKTDQFQDRNLFPFGFPIIEKSKGIKYHLEIESKSGSESSFVQIDNLRPVLVSKHQYKLHGSELFSNKGINYLLLKLGNLVSSVSLVFPIIFYSFPLIFYLILHTLSSRRIKVGSVLIIFPFLVLVISRPISLPQPAYWMLTFIILWAIYLIEYKLSPKINFVVASLSLFYMLYQLIENNLELAEDGAYWLFIFLSIAVIHKIFLVFHRTKTVESSNPFKLMLKP